MTQALTENAMNAKRGKGVAIAGTILLAIRLPFPFLLLGNQSARASLLAAL
jgi:hypothetical protein